MSGFMGFGQSGGESSANKGLNNIFNYSLPESQQTQATGQNELGGAADYFRKLLTAGRQETAQSSAPATNAVLSSADARKRQEATTGTGRTGGTAELNHERGAGTDATIDNIINQNLVGGRMEGAKGLQTVGSTELADAAQLLGIGSGTQQSALQNAIAKEGSQTGAFGKFFSALI